MSDDVPTEYRSVGRPPIIKTRQEMIDRIDDYFNNPMGRGFATVQGERVPRYLITGLANHLGMTRQCLFQYSNKSKFFDIVKTAKSYVEEYYEGRTHDPNPAGPIFCLKANFGWRDNVDFETEEDRDGLNVSINFEVAAPVDPETIKVTKGKKKEDSDAEP